MSLCIVVVIWWFDGLGENEENQQSKCIDFEQTIYRVWHIRKVSNFDHTKLSDDDDDDDTWWRWWRKFRFWILETTLSSLWLDSIDFVVAFSLNYVTCKIYIVQTTRYYSVSYFNHLHVFQCIPHMRIVQRCTYTKKEKNGSHASNLKKKHFVRSCNGNKIKKNLRTFSFFLQVIKNLTYRNIICWTKYSTKTDINFFFVLYYRPLCKKDEKETEEKMMGKTVQNRFKWKIYLRVYFEYVHDFDGIYAYDK